MKLSFSVCIIAALFRTTAFYTYSYAQDSRAIEKNGLIAFNETSPKLNSISNPEVRARINIKAVRRFKRYYQIEGEQWYKLSDCFAAAFKINGNSCRAYYGINGRWICTLKFYTNSDSLPAITKLARDDYKEYKALAVTEVESYASACYFVYIKNSTGFKIIKIQNNETEVYKEVTTQ